MAEPGVHGRVVSGQQPVLELRIKRTWFALGAVAVPAFGALIVIAVR